MRPITFILISLGLLLVIGGLAWVATHPPPGRAAFNRGIAAKQRKDYATAVREFTQCLAEDPGNLIARSKRANANVWLKNYPAALSDCDIVLQAAADQHWPPTHINYFTTVADRGISHDLSDHDAKAIADFRTLTQLWPNAVLGHRMLAWKLATAHDAALRNGPEAVTQATRACELTQWKDELSLDALAAAYARIGDFDNALKREHEAITLATIPGRRKSFETRLPYYEAKKPIEQLPKPVAVFYEE
jgi:tetratricopeptide (TPR) repeat protein